VMGVLASAFLLIPTVGLPGTLMSAGVANIVISVMAYFVSKGMPARLHVPAMPAPRRDTGEEKPLLVPLLAVAFFTGLSSFIYEIGWIRMLSLVLGASTYSFELMLATFILGLALGGWWVRNRIDAAADPIRLLAVIQIVMGLLAALSIPFYNGSFDLMAWLLSAVTRNEAGFVFFNLASTTICVLVMLPTTFCAGMTLPLITYRLLRSRTGEKSLGLVYSVNTVGGVTGVVIAVHLLLERLGLGGTLIAGAAIDVLLGAALFTLVAGSRRMRLTWGAGSLAALLALATIFQVDPHRSSSGVFRSGAARLGPQDRVAFHRDGKTATVDVLESSDKRAIRTNGKPDAAITMDPNGVPTGDEYTMALLAMLPLAHNPQAKSAAVIGFGSGMSTTLLLGSPRLERVETVEIEPAMVEGARQFLPVVAAAYNDKRSHIVIDDAKSYFARGRNRYDIIVSEPSNPWVSGVSSLFTEEFYARLATYLNEGGVLSQWVHTYQMDAPTLASILKAIAKTFPDYAVYSTNDSDIVVIARKAGPPGDLDTAVMEWPVMRDAAKRLGLTPDVVRRRYIASWRAIAPLVSTYGIAANSDFFPIVDHRASKTRFTNERADILSDLQTSPIPMLEMLDGASHLTRGRGVTPPNTPVEAWRQLAWSMKDATLDGTAGPLDRQSGGRSGAAFVVHGWATSCRDDVPFASVLIPVHELAETINPHLPPEAAAEVWDWVARSRCGSRLSPEDRSWIDLYGSIARRDPRGMVANAQKVLATAKGPAGPPTEIAVLAAAVGLVCQGRNRDSDALLSRSVAKYFRRNARETELRYLYGLNNGAAGLRRPDGACTAGVNAAAPPPAPVTSNARRSP
jgi:spermidine synthase